MKVLVDTPIWSYALRSQKNGFEQHIEELEALIVDQRVFIIGPIRQEILSGYSDIKKFELLNKKLNYFENTPVINDDYIKAANFSKICRQNGIQGSHTDFLICAVASRVNAHVFTSDKTFTHYQIHIPLKLHSFQKPG